MPSVGREEVRCRNCTFAFEVATQLDARCERCQHAFTEQEQANVVCNDCYRLNPGMVPRRALIISRINGRHLRLCASCFEALPKPAPPQVYPELPKPLSRPVSSGMYSCVKCQTLSQDIICNVCLDDLQRKLSLRTRVFSFGRKTQVSASEIALVIFGFFRKALQQNTHQVLLERAPQSVRREIQGCNPDQFNAEMAIFILFLIGRASDELPDEVYEKVSSKLDQLFLYPVSDATERASLQEAFETRIGLYSVLRDPAWFTRQACAYLLGTGLLEANTTALQTWLRMLEIEVARAQQKMIHSIMQKCEILRN